MRVVVATNRDPRFCVVRVLRSPPSALRPPPYFTATTGSDCFFTTRRNG